MFKLGAKALGIWIAVVIVICLLAAVPMYAAGWLQRITADFRGQTDVVEQISANAGYRIAKYEQFYSDCAAVQSVEARIREAESELNADPEPDDYRKRQLNTNLSALRGQRADLINDYNAAARMEDTQGNFRSSDLPYQIDIEQETTACTAE